ncbi:hypothetical protein ABZ410_15615 [Streptomyces cinnamoneus]|uniref:hypothetical protein n=1 Tax=Streptomyces cinnamoneus TaxID=53446 RepID=UPI0033E95D51
MAAPISVHRIDARGGRRVTARQGGVEQSLGRACCDADLVEFMRRVGVQDPELLLDDPETVEWLTDPAHQWTTQ